MLALYNTKLNDAEVSEAVRKIIAEKVHENDNDDVKRFLFGSIELTSLKTTDSDESILAFTERVNQFDSAIQTCLMWLQYAPIPAMLLS